MNLVMRHDANSAINTESSGGSDSIQQAALAESGAASVQQAQAKQADPLAWTRARNFLVTNRSVARK